MRIVRSEVARWSSCAFGSMVIVYQNMRRVFNWGGLDLNGSVRVVNAKWLWMRMVMIVVMIAKEPKVNIEGIEFKKV